MKADKRSQSPERNEKSPRSQEEFETGMKPSSQQDIKGHKDRGLEITDEDLKFLK